MASVSDYNLLGRLATLSFPGKYGTIKLEVDTPLMNGVFANYIHTICFVEIERAGIIETLVGEYKDSKADFPDQGLTKDLLKEEFNKVLAGLVDLDNIELCIMLDLFAGYCVNKYIPLDKFYKQNRNRII